MACKWRKINHGKSTVLKKVCGGREEALGWKNFTQSEYQAD